MLEFIIGENLIRIRILPNRQLSTIATPALNLDFFQPSAKQVFDVMEEIQMELF